MKLKINQTAALSLPSDTENDEDGDDLLFNSRSMSPYITEHKSDDQRSSISDTSAGGVVPSTESKESELTPRLDSTVRNWHFFFEPKELTEEELIQGPLLKDDEITKLVGWTRPAKARHVSNKSLAHWYRKFQPSKSDVIIATACKTGVTWLLQVCHSLRYQNRLSSLSTSLDFDDINEVTPWHMMAWDLDQDIWDQRGLSPKIFKSQQILSAEKRGAKYITIIRDPIAVLKSFFKYQKQTKNSEVNEMTSVDQFWANPSCFREMMDSFPGLMTYYKEAWLLRDNPNVLVVCYEDMLESIEVMLPTLARFLGIKTTLSGDLKEKVLSDSSRQSMIKNKWKYDESVTFRRLRKIGRNMWNRKPISSDHYNEDKCMTNELNLKPSEQTISEMTAHLKETFKTMSKSSVRHYGDLRTDIRKAFNKKRMIELFKSSSEPYSSERSLSPRLGKVASAPIAVPRKARRRKHIIRKFPSKSFIYEDIESSEPSHSAAPAMADEDFTGLYVHFLNSSDHESSSENMLVGRESHSPSKSNSSSTCNAPQFADSWPPF